MSQVGSHPNEQHDTDTSARLNWLRAGVLGANDGIVSTSGLVIGVAAAGAGQGALLTAGLAGLSAGAMSMAVGEYVSVSTQRDSEGALLAKELKLVPGELTSPWQAAAASALSFTLGALVPLLAILLLATDRKIPGTVMLAAVALAVTGWTSARLGGASPARAILRNVGGGLLAMAITFAIGRLFGASVS